MEPAPRTPAPPHRPHRPASIREMDFIFYTPPRILTGYDEDMN